MNIKTWTRRAVENLARQLFKPLRVVRRCYECMTPIPSGFSLCNDCYFNTKNTKKEVK